MLKIGNKIYRNLQEQVGYNSERIEQIADYIDGLDVQDSVIVLDSLSPLNSEQMKVAEQPLAFIVYDEAIYLKTKEDATYFYFEKMLKMELGTVITLSSAVIAVTKLNGATGITVSSVNVYSKSQIDTSLGLKADVTYVDTELAKKADLTGATFLGDVIAPTFKQSQFNYELSFNLTTPYSLEVENVYNRFAEINNVLYCIVNIKITNNTGATVTLGDGYGLVANTSLSLSPSIASKIYDIEGKTAADSSATMNCLISSEACQIMRQKVLNDSTAFIPARFSLVNRNVANTLAVQVAVNSGSGNRITLADGESIYVTSRMALTLI